MYCTPRMWNRIVLGCIWDYDFVDNKYDFKLNAEHKSFGNCVFKNCDLKNAKNMLFQSQVKVCFL